jgi:hypothetical protein
MHRMRAFTCLLPSQWLIGVVGFWAICGLAIPVGAQVPVSDGTIATEGAIAEASYTSSGTYFSRELGTPLRFGYHSEGYGTDRGVASLGAMKVFNLDGAAWFLDAQGTMSDDFGGGYNAGLGYRELVNLDRGFDAERILGASFWSDGQNTEGENFFNQLSFGLESLGESYDLRLNGYFPLERTKESDAEQISFDEIIFQNHELFAGREIITTSTAYSVIDAEFAKRIGNLDAWGIAGVYHLGGGGADDTGYRLGVRGYAVPDLAVTLQVTDDDIYHTNVMIGLTWFVGRTHTGNAPVGSIVDRFREPVWRNDFIATTASTREQGAGEALTDAENDEKFYFIHVDEFAAAGGDGSIENPFNNLAEAEAAQQAPFDDGRPPYVYMHGGSTFTPTDTFTLLDNVKFWGEGVNQFGDVVLHTVDTVERGTVFLPETSAGAQDLDSPTINPAAGVNFLELANNSSGNNFRMNGGATAIFGNGVNAPQLANIDINDPTNTGISLIDITGTTVIDNTVTIDGADTISMFIQGGEDGMNINAIINNDAGRALEIRDRTGGTIAYGGTITSTGGTGILIEDNVDANITFSDEISLATGINDALTITNNSAADTGATIRFDELLEIDTTDGDGVLITGSDDDMTYRFADIDIETEAGAGFTATGDGTLIVTSAAGNNSIATTTGRVLNLQGMAIGTGGANFDTVDSTGVAITGDNPNANAITLQNLDGTGQLRIGSGEDPGDGGTLVSNGNADDPAFFVNNVDNLVVNNVTIDNSAATGAGLVVTGQDGGTATFNGLNAETSGNAIAVNVNGNEGGTITFNNLVAESVNGTAVVVDNNEGATINFNEDLTVTATGTGQGFIASNGGTVGVGATGDTAVTTATGTGIEMNDITIAAGGAAFDKLTVNGAVNAATLTDVEGGLVTIGSGTTAPDASTVVTTGFAVEIDNADSVALTNLIVDNDGVGGTGSGIRIVNQDGTVSGTDVEIRTTDGNGLVIGEAGNPNGDDAITTFTDLEVTTTNGDAITIQDNEGGANSFQNLTATTSGSGDVVVINNNSDDTTTTFNQNLTLEATGTGNGIVATNGGTIATSGTGTRTVTTDEGVAVDMEDVIIGAGGFSLNQVNVTNGASNAITLTDTTGGQFRVGPATATGTPGAGGTIVTAGDAIVLDGVTNAVFNDLEVDATTGQAFDINHTAGVNAIITINGLTSNVNNGISLTDSGNGNLRFTLQNSTINTTAAGAEGFLFETNGTSGEVNISLLGNQITSQNASAVAATINSGTGDIQFLMDDQNVLNNNSAADATASFIVTASRTLNATIGKQNTDPDLDANTFTNANGAGTGFYMELDNASGRINLDLRGNTATGGAEDFFLLETAGTFSVVDVQGTITDETNNIGTVGGSPAGDFTNISPPIKQPN